MNKALENRLVITLSSVICFVMDIVRKEEVPFMLLHLFLTAWL